MLMSILVTIALVAAATDKPPPPKIIDATMALNEIVQGTRPCKELRMRYRDGNAAVGITEIRLVGRFARVIRTEPPAAPIEGREEAPAPVKTVYRGRLPKGVCERLARSADEGRLWAARTKRHKLLDDETQPHIRVAVKGKGSYSVTMPGFEVQNAPAFAITRGYLLYVARSVSNGAVLY